jgi:hypothetical protein
MDKPQILSAFNKHFIEFIEDVQRVFPDDYDISTILTSLSAARKINPRLIITTFKEHVINTYREEIEKGNLDFFIDNDYKNDLNKIGVSSPNAIIEKIDCLRGPVRNMNTEDRAKVMKYMQNLTKLSDLYSSK